MTFLRIPGPRPWCAVCSGVSSLEDGKKTNIWATYPAPPAEVTKMTVIVPLFEPIEGVPIN